MRSALSIVYFLPTQAERLDGASWVRCDVVIYLNGRVFQLPDSVQALGFGGGEVETAAAECARADGTTVVCTERHAFEVVRVPFVSHAEFTEAGGQAPPTQEDPLPFPKQSIVNALQGQCPAQAEWYYPVAEGAWTTGYSYLVCLG